MNLPSIDPRKAAVVADFLKEAFPGHHVYDREEFDRDCQFYRIDGSGAGCLKHRVRVSREFFDDHSEAAILQKLRDWDLPEIVRRAGERSVLVTNAGCQTGAEQS